MLAQERAAEVVQQPGQLLGGPDPLGNGLEPERGRQPDDSRDSDVGAGLSEVQQQGAGDLELVDRQLAQGRQP